jgi:hypothetical protein
MRKNWCRSLVWLGLLALLGTTWGLPETRAQSRIIQRNWGDYSWGFWGASRETNRLNREDVIARENYCPIGGCVLRLERVEVRPSQAHRGETLKLNTVYTLLTPEQVALPVAITREIVFQGKSLGKTKNVETRRLNGTWNQEITFTLPENAVPGDYTLITRISTGYAMDQKSLKFTVD